MTDDEKIGVGAGAIAIGIVVGAGISYLYTLRNEKAKRQKIDEWEREIHRCITNSYIRMAQFVESDEYSFDGLMQIYAEENRFLSIVQNQPPY